MVSLVCTCNHDPAGPHTVDPTTRVQSCTVCDCTYIDIDDLDKDAGLHENGGDDDDE